MLLRSLILVSALLASPAIAAPLELRIEGGPANPPAGAVLRVCVFLTAERFPNCEKAATALKANVAPTPGGTIVRFEDVPPGAYAASVLLDLDGDGVDVNFIGIPTEPVGFSGPPQRRGPPSFRRAVFQHPASAPVVVRLGGE